MFESDLATNVVCFHKICLNYCIKNIFWSICTKTYRQWSFPYLFCVCLLGLTVFHPCNGPYHSEGVCDGLFPHAHRWTQSLGHRFPQEALWHCGCQVRTISVSSQRNCKPPTFLLLCDLTKMTSLSYSLWAHKSLTHMENYKCFS